MENELLPVIVLAVLICPAYHRCPWLLVLVGGAAAISHFMPETSAIIRFAAIGGIGLAVLGYVVIIVSNILQAWTSSCREATDWSEHSPRRRKYAEARAPERRW